MAIFEVTNPYPVFIGSDGKPLDNGRVYIGEPGFEARSRPKAAFYDSDLTIPAATGSGGYIQTMAGYPFWNGAARAIYVDGNYSITITDRYDAIVFTALTQFFDEDVGAVADFSDITALAAATDLAAGERVNVQRGWQDQPEAFLMQTAGLYANNGATVVNVPPSGLQAVSFRREFATEAELVADTRPGTWFATDPASDVEGTVFRAAGSRGYRMALSVATDHDLITVGGVRLYGDAPSHGLLATENSRLIASLDATNRVAGLHRTDAATTGTFPTGIVAADRLGVIVGNGVAGEGFELATAIAQLRSFIRRKVASAFGAFRELIEVPVGAATGAIAYFTGTAWGLIAAGTDGAFMRQAAGIPSWSGGIFTSTDLTVSNAGAIGPIAHGLGAVPDLILCYLVCQTAQAGYTAGQIIPINAGPAPSATSDEETHTLIIDATNITGRFAASATVYIAHNTTTGVLAKLTNANFKLRIVAVKF